MGSLRIRKQWIAVLQLGKFGSTANEHGKKLVVFDICILQISNLRVIFT